MNLKNNKDKIDKFFNDKTEEELKQLWKKYDRDFPNELYKTMNLEQNEVLVKDFIILDDKCLGSIKTKRDVMISFTKDQEEFDYVDVFFTREQIIELRDRLNKVIDIEFCSKINLIY